jgi:phosphoribosylglycinamide formyltransferase-1
MIRRRLAVLASGRGSNLVAIASACERGDIEADLALLLCNRPGAGVLQLARRHSIDARCIDHREFPTRAAFDDALLQALSAARIDLVALAGFMRILGDPFIAAYSGSLLNIHPSLLPKYPGINTHQRALDAGDTEAGATVHFVIPELDAGPPILRARVPVQPGDTAERLAQRVLEVEHRLYPRAIAWCAAGRVTLREGRAWMDGEAISDRGGLWLDELP